jgi:hypothetical protein
MGVIGLALLALAIATVVWLFERVQGVESRHAPAEGTEREILPALPPKDVVETPSSLTCEDESRGNAASL